MELVTNKGKKVFPNYNINDIGKTITFYTKDNQTMTLNFSNYEFDEFCRSVLFAYNPDLLDIVDDLTSVVTVPDSKVKDIIIG